MAAQPNAPMTVEEYLTFDRASETKHEYFDGELLAMDGASYTHTLIVGNIAFGLHEQLRGRSCRVLMSSMRLLVQETTAFVYPDLTVICGQPQFRDERRDVLLNPTIIIGVLSQSTESHDRGQKFQEYRTIDSLREYVLVLQKAPRIEHFVRQTNNLWLFSESVAIESVLHLPTIDCTLALADIYQDVDLAGQATPPE